MNSTVDEMKKVSGAFDGDRSNLPSFEAIYPKQEAPILRDEDGSLKLDLLKWGVPLPSNPKRAVTNVRNLDSSFWKSMLTNPSKRCLVPVTEFCEWTGEKGSKRKVWFSMKDQTALPFAFAGIFRQTDDGRRMAFLTCEPNELVAPIHPKAMPVIVDQSKYDTWLNADWDQASKIAAPFPASQMHICE